MSADVLETRGDYRVRVILDECGEKPYNDGGGAVYDLDYGRFRWRATLLGSCSSNHGADLGPAIAAAWERWSDRDMLTRYLRAFYDVAGVTFADVGDWQLVALVTHADMRECWGFPDVAAYRQRTGRENPAGGLLDEWQAWALGDVWGYVVEKRARYANVADPADVLDRWREVDSCWGFYGREYVDSEALAALESAAADSASGAA